MEKIKKFFYSLRRNFTEVSREYSVAGVKYRILYDYQLNGMFYLYRENDLLIVANEISYINGKEELEVIKKRYCTNKIAIERYSLEGVFLYTLAIVDTYKKYDIIHYTPNMEGLCEKLISKSSNDDDELTIEIYKKDGKYFCRYNYSSIKHSDADMMAFIINHGQQPLIMIEKNNKRHFYNLYGNST